MEVKILYMVALLAFAWPAISEVAAQDDTTGDKVNSSTTPEVTTTIITLTATATDHTDNSSIQTTTDKASLPTTPSSVTTISTSVGSTTTHSSETTISTSEGSTTPPGSETTTTKSVETTVTTNPTTTAPPPVDIYLSYRIVNYTFEEAYYNLNSGPSQKLNATIAEVYESIYGCGTCPNHEYYMGYTLIAFRPGSVRAFTKLQYKKSENTTKPDFGKTVASRMENSKSSLPVADVRGESTRPEIPPRQDNSTSNNQSVPGWGIALLVLVCILVLFALIAILILLIRWCRRHQRGHLDIMSNLDSYHPMNEYPPYQTHGRYAAPNNKQNPYSETNNGTSPFSYTNPAMANDNL